MQTIVHYWPLWFAGTLVFAAYAAVNQLFRMGAILKTLDIRVSDVAKLFFNGWRFVAFVASAFAALGFFLLLTLSLILGLASRMH